MAQTGDGTPTSVSPVELSTTDVEVYAVPAGFVAIVKEILLANNQQTASQIEIQRRTAASVDYGIRVEDDANLIAAADTEIWELDLMLFTGESIRMVADTTNQFVSVSVIQATTGTDADPTPIAPISLTTTAQDILSVDSGHIFIVKEILAVNTNTAADNQVHFTRRTAASSDFHLRIDSANALVLRSKTEAWHLNLTLDEDEKLRGLASTTGVDVHVSGIRIKKT